MTLSGLMSRWTIFAACATASASAICRAIATLRSSGRPSVGSAAERSAVDQLHRDVAVVVDRSGLVDRDDVRVVERGGERGLAKQPFERVIFAARVADERAPNDLQRDVATKPRIVRTIDLAHAASTELAQDTIRSDAGAFRK